VGCEGRLDASGLALRRHDHSIKLSTLMVKPVHSLVFMRIYQEPKRLTITKPKFQMSSDSILLIR